LESHPCATRIQRGCRPPSDRSQVEGVHYVIAVNGKVEVKRPGRDGYAPVGFGTALALQDVLSLSESSTVTIVCADLSVREVQRPSLTGVPCPESPSPLLQWKGIPVNTTRGSREGLIPAVIWPRMTRLLNSRPTVRWLAVPNVRSYEVSVPGLNWNATVNGTELKYPDNAPALRPSQAYRFRITAHRSDLPSDVISSDEDTPNLGFTILNEPERDAIRRSENRIKALAIAEPAKQFLVACLYATNRLRSEALEILDGDLRTPPNGNVLYMAGELYREAGLYNLAETHYVGAIAASRTDDVDTRARVLESLALVYEAKGNDSEARKQWEAALSVYTKLSDQPSITRVMESIKRLAPKEEEVQKKQ
jgi:hypothetical protein